MEPCDPGHCEINLPGKLAGGPPTRWRTPHLRVTVRRTPLTPMQETATPISFSTGTICSPLQHDIIQFINRRRRVKLCRW